MSGAGNPNGTESYIAQRPCGCLIMAVVNDPVRRKDVAKEVAKAIRLGVKVSLVSSQQVREMPWKCPEHLNKGK